MLISLHWLPIKQCIEYKLATPAFRYFDGTSPPYLSHCLSLYTPHRSLRSSSHKLLCVPRVNLKSAGVCPNTNPIFYIFQIQPQNAPLPQCLHLSLWNCHRIHGLVGGGGGCTLVMGWWRGGGLQSMGLAGEPAAAATFSSAGRVCCVCLTACVCFMLVWYMSVWMWVCARARVLVRRWVCRCLCVII